MLEKFEQNISFDIWGSPENGKYRYKQQDGTFIDQTPADTCKRVAKALSDLEIEDKKEFWYNKFLEIMGNKFVGGGRIMANAGTNYTFASNINCVTMQQIPDSMSGILAVLGDAGLTLKAGCGVGYDFSTIRPKGAPVKGTGSSTSGVISFMKIYDSLCSTIIAGGARRGSQLGGLDIAHPEIEDFIDAKRQDNVLSYFNLSCLISDNFMKAVENDEDWELWFWHKTDIDPLDNFVKIIKAGDIPYNHSQFHYFKFDKEHVEVKFGNCTPETLYAKSVYKTIKAKNLFNKILKSTYDYGEPGVLFLDTINHQNNLYYCETIRTSNPCLVGDTMVMVADGRGYISIKQLADEGKDVPVYCLDENEKVVIKLMRNPRITGHSEKIYKITLDDGSILRTTSNHKFRLKDGKYKEVKDLQRGESLYILTKFEAPISVKKIRTKDYYWLYPGKESFLGNFGNSSCVTEHRLIAAFANGLEKIKHNYVVHHKDFNSKNNSPDNLQIMTEVEHCQLHSQNMFGDKNPMRRAKTEWSDEKWKDYHNHMSKAVGGKKNGRYLGISNERLKELMTEYTKQFGRKISRKEWEKYAKLNHYPKFFNEWRKDFFKNDITDALKNIALELGYQNLDEDPRVLRTYENMISQGYETKIENHKVYVKKVCEYCKKDFWELYSRREVSFCSLGCSGKRSGELQLGKNISDETRKIIQSKQNIVKTQQIEVFNNLKLSLNRIPLRKEWAETCKQNNISQEICRKSSPFKSWDELVDAAGMYNHKIVSVELDGIEDVYNGTVDDHHNFFVGGFEGQLTNGKKKWSNFNNLNCGEQPLNFGGSCLLGSMMLPVYVNNPFETEKVTFDFDSFEKDIFTASRFLDNVVEINNLPLELQREQMRIKRRHGLGYTGFGSMLNMMGISYGSQESVDLVEKIMKIMAQQSLLCNISLAKEKGCAPIFETFDSRMSVLSSKYLERILDTFSAEIKATLIEDIKVYGLRYSHATTIAPTGTLSITWGQNCSSGIEPAFANSYKRNVRVAGKKTKVQEEVMDYAYYLWTQKYGNEPLPSWWRVTNDLKVEDHLKIQAMAQKYVDSAISKTINIPIDYSFEDFQKVYMEGWKRGLKGMTTFRFNPKFSSGVLVEDKNLQNTTYSFTLEDGSEVVVSGSDKIEYDGEVHIAANLFDALKNGLYGNM